LVTTRLCPPSPGRHSRNRYFELDISHRLCKSNGVLAATLHQYKLSSAWLPLLVTLLSAANQCATSSGDIRMDDASSKNRVTLKTVADHLGLTPGTISAVLNNTRGALRIPQTTRDRITAAARELNYQPNPLARALRTGHAPRTRASFDSGATRGALVIMDSENFLLAISAIEQAGLRVPDDVSVVEFDSKPAAMEYSA